MKILKMFTMDVKEHQHCKKCGMVIKFYNAGYLKLRRIPCECSDKRKSSKKGGKNV